MKTILATVAALLLTCTEGMDSHTHPLTDTTQDPTRTTEDLTHTIAR